MVALSIEGSEQRTHRIPRRVPAIEAIITLNRISRTTSWRSRTFCADSPQDLFEALECEKVSFTGAVVHESPRNALRLEPSM